MNLDGVHADRMVVELAYVKRNWLLPTSVFEELFHFWRIIFEELFNFFPH